MRTKRWLLVGTVLPALVLSQTGQAFTPQGVQLAQAPGGGDDDRGRGQRGDSICRARACAIAVLEHWG